MLNNLSEILNNGVITVVLSGTILLGLVSGALGVFTVLRKQELIGDALSHSTLPGVVIMFMITFSKDVSVLIIGAAISAALAMFLMGLIKKYSILENDALAALILSSFFGLGRFLISLVSRNPEYSKAKLDDYIFGSAATMIERDVYTLFVVCVLVLFILLILWGHFKIQTFNPEFYQSLGYSNKFIEFVMSFMIILVIVVGIRSVGVILMSALLITPAISARQWSDKLHINVFLAAIFGAISAFVGTTFSVSYPTGLPTGPMIVIVGTLISIVSVLFAPKRGLIAKAIEYLRHREAILKNKELINLIMNNEIIETDLIALVKENYIEKNSDGKYKLTTLGDKKIKELTGGKSNG